MAAYDAEVDEAQRRMAELESEIQALRGNQAQQHHHIQQINQQNMNLANEASLWRDQANRHAPPPPYHPPPPPRPNLNLPTPPSFSGIPSELRPFKLRVTQFIGANIETYATTQDQLIYVGSLLVGKAREWHDALVEDDTFLLPPSYTFQSFLQEMDDFFGGGVTLQSMERSLINLRQTGTVSELAIAFQNITNTFRPKWSDHPLIFTFSQKLREVVRYELTSRGLPPSTFQAFISAAISVEQNQAAAHASRGGQPPHTTRPSFKALQPPPTARPPPSHSPHTPMDIDATRGPHGSLTPEERRRRFNEGLCGYCGRPGHVISSCPNKFQARGVFELPPGFQLVHQSQFPGPWQQFPLQPPPSPSPFSGPPPAVLPAPDTSKNSRSSQ